MNKRGTFPSLTLSSTPDLAPFRSSTTDPTYLQIGNYIVHHQPCESPASTVGQVQVALARSIGLGSPHGSESTICPKSVSDTLQYNIEDTTRCYNTLQVQFYRGVGDMFPGWLEEELDDRFIKFELGRDITSENFTMFDNENMI